MRARFWYLAGIAGLVAVASAAQPALAQDVNRIVRSLNAILNPQDAQRLEERAHREGREEEERYWRDYRAGLEHRPSEREAPQYRDGDRRSSDIGPDEARRFEEQSRRSRHFEEEHYWRDYRAGLEHRPESDRARYEIGPDEARRFEEQPRRNHKLEEERYWRDYRAGLGR